jgi:hypothetical protein
MAKPAPRRSRPFQGLQALERGGPERLPRLGEKVGDTAHAAPAHPPPQLVELRQPNRSARQISMVLAGARRGRSR